MNKKYLVLPAVLVVAAAAAAAAAVVATERTAGLLQDGRGGAVRVDESGPDGSGSGAKASDPVFSTVCFVNRENADDKNADDKSGMRLQYTLDVRSTNALNDPPKGSTPVGGGLKGWVGQWQSEVQAPDGCAKEMGRPEARYVTVTLKVSPVAIAGRDWDYASLKKDERTVILEAVENLAKQYDCAA
ncbi:hypothetical protein JI76_13475 [Streptomyces anulatus]|uniref:hypothetical protein n=1 Tax=Streptomyces anulatus TaxID=1892 RepID=UPI0006DB738F|nr:hypothetical protein [Streptomyces anulatus]KPL33437.1 hypothetical protein JI76_13475 [Streptomyces anulatus]